MSAQEEESQVLTPGLREVMDINTNRPNWGKKLKEVDCSKAKWENIFTETTLQKKKLFYYKNANCISNCNVDCNSLKHYRKR